MQSSIELGGIVHNVQLALSKTFKCVIVGDGGVGKTTYLVQLGHDRFDQKYCATLGVEVHPLTFSVFKMPNYTDYVRFNVWDTAGQEKFGGLREGYYIQADCAMVFFDLTNRLSFKNAFNWLRDIEVFTKNIVIVGTKTDLSSRKVSEDDILTLTKNRYPYCEISTKTSNKEDLIKPFTELYRISQSQTIDGI